MRLPGVHVTGAPAAMPHGHGWSLPQGFSQQDRTRLLLANGIGPGFVQSLERAGFSSIAEMRAIGVQAVLRRMSDALGSPILANRAKPLGRALDLDTFDGVPAPRR
jgi:hypothetical protein